MRCTAVNTIKFDKKNVKTVAHRGLSGLEKENTNAAFVAAGNRSYYGIETDVHKTADGRFVVIHDNTPERITDGRETVNIEKSNYSDFKDIILPDIDGKYDRTDIRIPLLCEYVRICKKYEKKCVLELKQDFSTEDLKEIIDILKAEDYLENVIFISFFMSDCIRLRPLVPDNDIQFLTSEEVTDELIENLLEHKLNLDIYFSRLNKETVDNLHSKGILVNCWTVNKKQDGEALSEMGIDFITTNILE